MSRFFAPPAESIHFSRWNRSLFNIRTSRTSGGTAGRPEQPNSKKRSNRLKVAGFACQSLCAVLKVKSHHVIISCSSVQRGCFAWRLGDLTPDSKQALPATSRRRREAAEQESACTFIILISSSLHSLQLQQLIWVFYWHQPSRAAAGKNKQWSDSDGFPELVTDQ